MTPQQLRTCAKWLRRLADEVPAVHPRVACELADWLVEKSVAMEAAAEAQPTVETRCDGCRWWNEIDALRPKGVGKCVRLAPGRDDLLRATWPTTFSDDRCGEFSPREVGT